MAMTTTLSRHNNNYNDIINIREKVRRKKINDVEAIQNNNIM